MNLETTDHGREATVLHLDGRLTMVSATTLRAAVDRAVAAGRPKVVVDLAATTFLDSSGLGALVSSLKATRQAGGDLRIAAPTGQARTVLGLTNLDRVLRPYERVEDATDGW